jgi:hypothetical protein
VRRSERNKRFPCLGERVIEIDAFEDAKVILAHEKKAESLDCQAWATRVDGPVVPWLFADAHNLASSIRDSDDFSLHRAA